MLLNIRTMATNFSRALGVFCFNPIPKYCNVWYEGSQCIIQLSITGPSWPSCYIFTLHLKAETVVCIQNNGNFVSQTP